MKILAATDGSARALAAVRFAAWLGRVLRAEVEVVLVGDVASIEGLSGAARRTMKADYRRWAMRAIGRAEGERVRTGVRGKCRYVEARRLEPIAEAIARSASAARADLVVVGTHGRGAVGRALLGSVTRRLVHVCRRPLVVVPGPVAARPSEALRLLVATDGSAGAAAAARLAGKLARRARRSRLEVATVSTLRRDLSVGFSAAILAFLPYEELRRSERRAAQRILSSAEGTLRSRGVRAETSLLEPRDAGPVADAIAARARKTGAHLVAIGRSGRSALADWALGSVARRLLGISRRPVLLAPAPRRAR
ncbi:MAG TPA: universal stress protein [Thermoanaerobaculia bacterium]|nr:universal stress protein [Thermoanaerobaculia bacterium]